VRRLEFIGTTDLYEPCGLLFRSGNALAELVSYLVALRRPLYLQRVPADGGLVAALRSAGSGRLVSVRSASCNRVDLTGSWGAYLAGRSRECRAGFPRKWKQLSTGGKVTFESLAPDPDDAATLLDEFQRVEASSWKFGAGSAVTTRPHLREFFRELSRRFAARGQVRMCFLRCDGRAVAAQIGLHYGDRIWELKVGYDERWRAASPGRLLLWQMLRDAFTRGMAAYEFLGTGDGQQTAWSTSEQRLQTLVFYPYSIRGAVAAATDASDALIRRTTQALMPAKGDRFAPRAHAPPSTPPSSLRGST
jgi:CelD/BcsL family acetyltransferase involved in cellulose biosynthesis